MAFGQWQAARRLVERGARTTLWQAAALGLMPRVEERFATDAPPASGEVTNAFWCACHGGQRGPAEYLLGRGADLNWIPNYAKQPPLDVAGGPSTGREALITWLRDQGAASGAA